MPYASFHTHCNFCDGKEPPQTYVEKAISLQNISIGFSSHAPLPFENPWTLSDEKIPAYIKEINRLKEEYKNKIQIYTGMEIDYIPGSMSPGDEKFRNLNLDFVVGSIHLIKNDNNQNEFFSVDGSLESYENLFNYAGRDPHKLVWLYYSNIRKMIEETTPEIIGHFDIINKNNIGNKYFDPEAAWYKEEVVETLKTAKKYDSIIEINTGGMARKYYNSIYPAPWILEECKKLNIRIMVNSDAHNPDNLNYYYENAFRELKNSGYNEHYILIDNEWKSFKI